MTATFRFDARSGDLHLAGRAAHAVGFAQHVLQIDDRLRGEKIAEDVHRQPAGFCSSRSRRRTARIGVHDAYAMHPATARRMERSPEWSRCAGCAAPSWHVHVGEFAARRFNPAAAGFQVGGHAVERLHQLSDLAAGSARPRDSQGGRARFPAWPPPAPPTAASPSWTGYSASQVEANSTPTVSSSRNPR